MSFVRIPPDSTGKKVYTIEQTIGTDVVQTQVVHLADKKYPNQFQAIDKRGSSSVRFAEGQPIMAGFGQLKVQEDRALGVYESSISNYEELFSTQLIGGGSSVYEPQASSMVLRVDGALNSSATRTTNKYHYYLPGSANFVKMSIGMGDYGKPGNVRRWGAFDDDDGLFFELNGTTLYTVIRSSVTGTVTEMKTAQADFNIDKLNGTGWSGHTLDIGKINVWWIDYQWLGAGRVRFGIYEPNGTRLVIHEFWNAGNITLPYMRTGTLPLRTQNFNTAATGATSELREVCVSIYTEGTYEDYAFWRSSNVDSTKTLTTATEENLATIRAKSLLFGKHNGSAVYPETINVAVTGGPIAISLYQGTSATGGSWELLPDNAIDFSTDATINTTNARKYLTRFFGEGVHTIDLSQHFEINDNAIHVRADGTPELWSFMVKKLSGAASTVTFNLCYRELW